MDERFWIMPIDDDVHPQQLADAGWWAVVDNEAGGVIAYAAAEDTAVIIRDAFAR